MIGTADAGVFNPHPPYFDSLTNVANGDKLLRSGATATELSGVSLTVVVANKVEWLQAVAIVQPSGGSHTYKLSVLRLSGTGSLTMYAGAAYPAFILVEDIGSN